MTRSKKTPTIQASDGLENVVANLGTSADKKAASTYAQTARDRLVLENMYRTSWIAKRIINCIPDDMTRNWRELTIDDDGGDSLKKVAKEERRLGVRAKVNESLRWGRLYGGCLILMGTADAKSDPKILQTPLKPESIGEGGLSYLQPVDRWRVTPSADLVKDLDSPDFGLPVSYTIAESGIIYHHSRILRFDGQKIPYYPWFNNARWSDSELMHVWDAVINKDSASSIVASLMHEAKIDVISVPELYNLLSTRDGEATLLKRFRAAKTLQSINNVLLLGEGEAYEQKTYTFTGLDSLLDRFADDVCGASEIPRTRLFGQSPGGLNSTGDGDLSNYYDSIHAKQESDLRPILDKLDQVLIRSALGAIPEDFDYEFKSLWQVPDKTKAEIDYLNAQRDQIYINAGVVSEPVAARTLQVNGTYSGMTDEDVGMVQEIGFTPMPGRSKVETED